MTWSAHDLFGPQEVWLPAISMWQPYASLLFVTEPAHQKLHETRSHRFPRKYAGLRIAIQAGLSMRHYVSPDLAALAAAAFGSDWQRTLPRGAYIGTVVLAGYDLQRKCP